jgi:nucleotide-binding universal stress UspA family protein
LRDAFIGTTAERAIRAATCPVLMVNGPPVGPWGHVLLTTDLSESDERAFKKFTQLGLGADARLTVLNVFDAPALCLVMANGMGKEEQQAYLDDLRADAWRKLTTFMGRTGVEQAEKIVRREETTVASEILETAKEKGVELVVVATQGKGALARMVLGSVAQQVLNDAQCDVLAIAPQGT